MKDKIGPTGKFPHGKFGLSDQGGLNVGVALNSKGYVIINFGTEVSWLAMPPEDAINFAKTILNKAGAKKITVEF